MTKQQKATYRIKIPVHIEVRSVRDETLLSGIETVITWLLSSQDIDRLKRDSKDVLHHKFATSISNHVYERFHLEIPETYAKILVKGNVLTWEKEPYLRN